MVTTPLRSSEFVLEKLVIADLVKRLHCIFTEASHANFPIYMLYHLLSRLSIDFFREIPHKNSLRAPCHTTHSNLLYVRNKTQESHRCRLVTSFVNILNSHLHHSSLVQTFSLSALFSNNFLKDTPRPYEIIIKVKSIRNNLNIFYTCTYFQYNAVLCAVRYLNAF